MEKDILRFIPNRIKSAATGDGNAVRCVKDIFTPQYVAQRSPTRVVPDETGPSGGIVERVVFKSQVGAADPLIFDSAKVTHVIDYVSPKDGPVSHEVVNSDIGIMDNVVLP